MKIIMGISSDNNAVKTVFFILGRRNSVHSIDKRIDAQSRYLTAKSRVAAASQIMQTY
ncbi:MAG: hypothetical protein SPJ62_08260 [Inconstantimicrobium porci]|uniref:hypothetical protein n=1 Tax=Inconstantimicrobium porci TaxID=2652291 RepID=UPI00240A9317|nr:hypothetical protein [Inconstantimicrobium porci]MDD6770584.1 hypothetical protein [Inconstantimicrobium porci]MDY5911979.1 hypothetical protein [Inconstantimicrobium porci]